MPFDARAIANEFLKLAHEENTPVTTMKLVKLVYIAHGWSLGLGLGPLIDEPVEAWQYGPVIPSMYRAFKKYGGNPIDGYAEAYDPDLEEFIRYGLTGIFDDETDETENARDLVKKVWDQYGKLPALRLSTITHQPDTPWSITTANGIGLHNEIPDNLIKLHYEKLAAKAQGA